MNTSGSAVADYTMEIAQGRACAAVIEAVDVLSSGGSALPDELEALRQARRICVEKLRLLILGCPTGVTEEIMSLWRRIHDHS